MRTFPRITWTLPLLAVGLIGPVAAASADCTHWPDTVYLLRHAERLNNKADSPLSPAGWKRAGGLPTALGDVVSTAIFVTERQRTQQTAMSLAAHSGVKPVVLKQSDLDELLDSVCDAGRKGADAVVIVGHSTTLSPIMAGLGVDADELKKLPVTEDEVRFGDLFLIDPSTGDVDPRRYGDCP